MKVAYYTDQLYKYGGIEQVISNKMNYFAQNSDYELYLLTFEQKNNELRYGIGSNIETYDLGINYLRQKSYLHFRNLIKAPVHYFRLKKWLRTVNPDILIICHYSFDFYFLPYLKRNNKPVKIKEFHSSRHYDYLQNQRTKNPLKKLLNRINRYIESKYDYLAVLTEDEKSYYHSDNVVVIPNAISSIPEKAAKLENKKVISAGRLAPVKGFDLLIVAWQIVQKKHSDWKLEIFGDGDSEYTTYLNSQIQKFGLEKSVSLPGSTPVMIQEMTEASIYAMASKTECFPMVLLESLSCGLPVVSFDCPNGPRHIIIQNEDGFLIQDQEVEDLANKLDTLISDQNLRIEMGKSGRKNVQRFLPEHIMNKWTNLFNTSTGHAI